MLRVRADEPGAFEELVARFQERLLSVLHHLVGDQQEAEDLAQEVFLRVYRARKDYHPQARFSTWLFTIAHHLASNALRRRRRKPTVPLRLDDSGPLGIWSIGQALCDRQPAPEQKLAGHELAAVVRQALDQLNDRQRLAVILNKFEDLSYQEIAEIMGTTSKAVKSLLSRARTQLRDLLRDYLLPPDKDGSTR
ncbi:MAG: RNA polymerase subunit sigma-70 [Gemmataceae bacterium]